MISPDELSGVTRKLLCDGGAAGCWSSRFPLSRVVLFMIANTAHAFLVMRYCVKGTCRELISGLPESYYRDLEALSYW